MNTAIKTLSMTALCIIAGAAAAQQASTPAAAPADSPAPAAQSAAKAPKSTAQSEAGEPRADTSGASSTAASADAAPIPAPAKAPKRTAQSEAGAPRSDTSGVSPTSTPAASPSGAQALTRTVPATAGGAARQKSSSAADKLNLGTATVTGSQEQPKVMYIVPWKRSDIGDLAGKPMNSLVDEILAPVDRDVFKREVVYYQAVQADASQNGAPDRPSQQGEK